MRSYNLPLGLLFGLPVLWDLLTHCTSAWKPRNI